MDYFGQPISHSNNHDAAAVCKVEGRTSDVTGMLVEELVVAVNFFIFPK